jgi:hypothetical protein
LSQDHSLDLKPISALDYQIEKLKAHCILRDFAPVTQRNDTLVSDLERMMRLPDYGNFDILA